ncbi:1,2-phenylacetyl-CoA epoxidase subunit PaaA [Streptomyces sp. NPDC051677]|uniref:1,2-phenylacetyl-CoA epoxidase subunit PaaA n=1 Tax=Streptomyces sp. NPDC051677 TaxID=3365669 RepID=UPI0037D003F1
MTVHTQADFDRVIADDEQIEPGDWMPEGYRASVARQVAQHAHSEIIGMQPEGQWIGRAPSLRRKAILLAKVQDEAGHGLYLYGAAETLGQTRDEALDLLHAGRQRYAVSFDFGMTTWADVAAMGWLGDGAAIINQIPLSRCSYGPYARAMTRVCKEENFHQRQGFEAMCALAFGTPAQRRMAQNALNAYWMPSLILFGPPDGQSPRSADSMRWKIKKFSNDELRQRFVDATAPQAEYLGLRIPDDNLKLRPDGHYQFTPPNMDDFAELLRGNGPYARERRARRLKAHQDGTWVREALAAHARRQAGPAAQPECPEATEPVAVSR